SEGVVHRMGDLGKEGLDLVLREVFGERSSTPEEMGRLDWIDRQGVALHHEILKKVFDRMQTAVDRRRSEVDLALLLDEGVDIAPGHCTGVLGERREKQAQVPAIILDGVGRIVPPVEVRTEVVNGSGVHAYLPPRACRWVICAMACSYWCFLVVS